MMRKEIVSERRKVAEAAEDDLLEGPSSFGGKRAPSASKGPAAKKQKGGSRLSREPEVR